jgi:exonuclease SbcD
MKPFSFIHAADLHLDTPFTGISKVNPSLQSILQNASLTAFDNLIQVAITRKVNFVLFAGDIYDGVEHGIRAQDRFLQGLRRLDEHGIWSLFIHGNHDPLEEGWSALRPEDFPAKAVRFDQWDQVRAVSIMSEGEAVATVHGISFRKKAETRNLSLEFPKHRSDRLFHVGMLHCNVGGQTGHDNYAPCTLDDLRSRAIDYWALGHIHERSLLNAADPVVLYPGNLQARRFDESGPKGCTLVQVDSFGHPTLEMIEADVVRFARFVIEIDGLTSINDILNACDSHTKDEINKAERRTLVSRISLHGQTSAHGDLLRAEAQGGLLDTFQERLQFDRFWLDSVTIKTRPLLSRSDVARSAAFEGALVRLTDALLTSDEDLAHLTEVIETPLITRRRFDDLLPKLERAEFRRIVLQAESRLLGLLDIEEET